MSIVVEHDLSLAAPNQWRVILDLHDGRKLRSDGMSEADAESLKLEIDRRVFCIEKDAADGRRDRM